MSYPPLVAPFPALRARRLRQHQALRRLVCESHLRADDFIYPLFVRHGHEPPRPIASMPGQFQWSVGDVVHEAERVAALGIPAVLLFGIPSHKDGAGSDNYAPDGIIPTALRAIKAHVPELLLISDMCFCEYTDHGHCGLINQPGSELHQPQLAAGSLLNDATRALLGRASLVHAQAGADVIAPSGMVDGMVGAIRHALDEGGFAHIPIMSYAAKYASAFYGPFRDAAESPPQFGDRHSYQMAPSNRREALKEVALDVAEGADLLIVKPALPYLDIVSDVRAHYTLPLAAYQVSGEYAMLHAAAANGWLPLEQAALESLISIKRAGADMIITYFAKKAVGWL